MEAEAESEVEVALGGTGGEGDLRAENEKLRRALSKYNPEVYV
jgi:hypothetical protein